MLRGRNKCCERSTSSKFSSTIATCVTTETKNKQENLTVLEVSSLPWRQAETYAHFPREDILALSGSFASSKSNRDKSLDVYMYGIELFIFLKRIADMLLCKSSIYAFHTFTRLIIPFLDIEYSDWFEHSFDGDSNLQSTDV